MKHTIAAALLALSLTTGTLAFAADDSKNDWHQKREQQREEMIATLPADQQQPVRDLMKAMMEKREASKPQMKALYEERKTLLTAASFDKTAFLAKSQEIDHLMSKNIQASTEMLAESATSMSQEQRTVLANMLGKKDGYKRDMKHEKKEGIPEANTSGEPHDGSVTE